MRATLTVPPRPCAALGAYDHRVEGRHALGALHPRELELVDDHGVQVVAGLLFAVVRDDHEEAELIALRVPLVDGLRQEQHLRRVPQLGEVVGVGEVGGRDVSSSSYFTKSSYSYFNNISYFKILIFQEQRCSYTYRVVHVKLMYIQSYATINP